MKKTRKTGWNQEGWEKTRTARWTLEEKILGQRGGHMKEKYQDSEMDTSREKTRTTRQTHEEKRLEQRDLVTSGV